MIFWHGINDTYDAILIAIAAIATLLIAYHVIMLMIEGRRVIKLCNKMKGE